MITALVLGALLGVSAGLSPGPMLALVLAQTLRHGPREGCKVALVPLITDPPIILAVLALAAKLAEIRPLLGMVSIGGAAFLLYLAGETFRAEHHQPVAPERPNSWLKGVITNLLNPHPWIFWLTVGTAILAKAMAQSWHIAAAFLFGFYAFLIGSKMAVALLAGRSRNLLTGRGYFWSMRLLAVLLAVFAIVLLGEGVKHLARA